MIGLPKPTEFNKRIPKQRFYDNLLVSQPVKKVFVEQVKAIYWRNKLASTTLNISPGRNVLEIEVFEISLNASNLDENIMRFIDGKIPYHILFILEYEEKNRAVIGYKSLDSSKATKYKVDAYYYTEWMHASELSLRIEGLTLDDVYENFIRQIAGTALPAIENTTLKENIELQKLFKQLEKKIAVLEARIKNERQPKRKFELVCELKTVQTEYKLLTR